MIVKNLNKTIDKQAILKNIDLELAENEIVGLVGRNGSGKTTLFRILANHYLPDTGNILIDQKSIVEH